MKNYLLSNVGTSKESQVNENCEENYGNSD